MKIDGKRTVVVLPYNYADGSKLWFYKIEIYKLGDFP